MSGPSASAAPHRTITQAQNLQSVVPAQSTPLAASVQSAADQWKATPPLFLPPNPPPNNPSPLPSSSLTSLYPLLQQSQAALPWQVSQPAMGSTNDRRVAKALLHRTQESSPFGTARGSSHPRASRRGYPVHNTTKPDKGKGRSAPTDTFEDEVRLSILLMPTPVIMNISLDFFFCLSNS